MVNICTAMHRNRYLVTSSISGNTPLASLEYPDMRGRKKRKSSVITNLQWKTSSANRAKSKWLKHHLRKRQRNSKAAQVPGTSQTLLQYPDCLPNTVTQDLKHKMCHYCDAAKLCHTLSPDLSKVFSIRKTCKGQRSPQRKTPKQQ